jgi:hypothetical protein
MMSGRDSDIVRENAILVLAAMALVSAGAYAANPNPGPKQEKAKTPATASLSSKPKPAVTQGSATLTRETPLREAIDILRHSTTPPLSIIVLWKPLNGAGIYENTPIGIDGVARLRVGQYLELLTLSLSAGASAKVGYAIDKGVITISTTDALPAPKPAVRVYDISDLVAPPGQYSPTTTGFGMGYGGPIMPYSGYAGAPGGAFSSPAVPSGTTAANVRNYRGR